MEVRTPMRRVLIGATMTVAVGLTAACGAPDDASTEDFCRVIQDLPAGDKPSQDEIDDYVDELEDTGTPEGISKDARKGFETWSEVVADIDIGDSAEEIQKKINDELEGDRELQVQALFEYVAKNCTPAG